MNADGTGGVVANGYLLSEGEFTIIDFPGAQVNSGVSRIAQRVGNEANRQNRWRRLRRWDIDGLVGYAAWRSRSHLAPLGMAQSSDAQLIAENTQSRSGKLPSGFNGNCEIAVHSNYKVAAYRLGILLK